MASLPESAPPSRPPPPAASRDLDDAEFAELAGLLADIPEPLQPLALDEADGFAAGIAVQAETIDAEAWQRHVFDAEGHRWGEAQPSPEKLRASALLSRRESAIRRSLAEFGGFEPWLAAAETSAPNDESATADPAGDPTTDLADPTDPTADPIRATVVPWVFGFLSALDFFPPTPEPGDERTDAVVAHLERYLGDEIADKPASVDAAVDEVVACVFALYEVGEAKRYRVTTARRDAAKVGRNDPCPCGSGRKFKHCHGAG